MNRLHAIAIGGVAIASIVITVFLYYFFLPAWLLVERIEDTEHDVISLPDFDVGASPKLKEALETADERYDPRLPGTISFKLAVQKATRF